LRKCRSECFEKLAGRLEDLCSTLELTFLRNTIVGRSNSEEFYNELLETSRSNRRNSKEYVDYIRAPIIEMLTENRAKL
jgi:hypothetical protein